MIPRSLSASSVQVWACPARWRDEVWKHSGMLSGSAATKGTVCHAALEWYVVSGLWKDIHGSARNKTLLQKALVSEYAKLFGDDMQHLAECTEMVMRWYDRTTFVDRTVLSAEVKSTFALKTSAGEIPFNYVWDRCDQLVTPDGSLQIEVVDYKTLIRPLRADALKDKIQARCYGLAAQIAHPTATRIWVTFDMLRYDPIGIVFTREENAATWRYLKKVAEEMIATPEDEAAEFLNPDCRWCIRKTHCAALRQHGAGGGVLALGSPQEAAQQRADLENARGGVEAAIRELDDYLLAYAEKAGEQTFPAGDLDVMVEVGKRRSIDLGRALKIVPPEVVARYGSLTMKGVDSLLKSDELTREQKTQLRGLIEMKYSEPRIKTERRNPIDDD